jgi:DNA anti-recombination protein RmuC
VNSKDSKPDLSGSSAAMAAAALSGEAASVDKIRDILFGGQMRDYERKFGRLEDRLTKETSDLKDEVKRSLGAFDQFVKQELESLAGRLKSEQDQRQSADRDLAGEIKELKQALQQATAQLDDRISTMQRELRQQLLDQYRSLSDDISRKSADADAALKRESGELRFEKADRAALAGLFNEVALRLKDEFKIPGAEHLKNG